MIGNLWHYGVVKTLRKAVALPLARMRGNGQHRSGRPAAPVMTAYGVSMMENWLDRTFVYCHGGIYGRFLSEFLERQTAPFTFIDIGANQGVYSLIAARNPACQRVIAFEPVQTTHDLLLANIRANRLDRVIQPLKLAIARQPGPLVISIPDGHSGMASLATSPDRQSALATRETIMAVNASQLGDLLAGDGPMLVKVDVEGQENAVIGQLLACSAAGRITTLFYEVDTRWSDGSAIEQQLRAAGFTQFRKVGFGHHFDVMASR